MEGFQAVERIYGDNAIALLNQKNILIIGLGGVGSWALETIVRSGIGKVTIVDLDEVCISNTNRQLQALSSTIGMSKVSVLKSRARDINPDCHINAIEDFYTPTNSNEILKDKFDYIIDCIDSVQSKAHLIFTARELKLPIISVGGAGGKKDFSQIRIDDLNRSYNDKLLMQLRKKLKKDYGFTKFSKKKFNIPCIFSPEDVIIQETNVQNFKGRNCQNSLGSLMHVTAIFGIKAAGYVINSFFNDEKVH